MSDTYFIHGDALTTLRKFSDGVVQTCVTSPPYFGLRDYDHPQQIGLEVTPCAYVDRLVAVFREVRRVLRDDGTLWLNLGDSYVHPGSGSRNSDKWPLQSTNDHKIIGVKRVVGLPAKNLIGIPWRVAFALQDDGWILRQEIIWHKPNAMPEGVEDRCTKSHEYIFMLTKTPKYYYDGGAIKENAVSGKNIDGLRNRRSVWTIPTKAFRAAHFATFPPELIEPCILAGAPIGGIVLDPFGGAGTTNLVSKKTGRVGVSIELNADYIEIAQRRCAA